MTRHDIDSRIDDDYIDVEKERADVSISKETDSENEQIADTTHEMDIRRGNGSSSKIEDLIDKNAIIEHDGRADTRTFFRAVEAPDDEEETFERLIGYQEGMWDQQSHETKQNKADRMRWMGTFCGQLDMTTHQHDRIEHVVEGLNMAHMAHYSSQKVILAVISLVADEDASRHGERMRDRDDFRRLLRAVDGDLAELKQIRKLVRDKSERL